MFKECLSKHSNIIITAIVATLLTNPASILLTYLVTNKVPNIIVRQYYNTVDPMTEVPNKVGELIIEYQKPKSDGDSVYKIEVANNGRAPDEDLSVQVEFPTNANLSFFKTPDLRVYNPEKIELTQDGFFMTLKKFPRDAVASISFIPPENKHLLCSVKLKAAAKAIEGKVEAIEGLQCD